MRLKMILLLMLLLWLAGCGSEGDTAVTNTRTTPPTQTPEIGLAFATKAPPTVPVLQTTPTPLPTATATPTPTPIIHTIQSGETLLGIAIQHGTTTEEIQALNPGVDPRLLLVGQQIVLPQPTAVAQTAGGTAVPLDIDVLQIQAYRAPVGSVWLVGEVQNEGTLPVDNVQLEVGLLTASGELAGTAVGWAAGPIILPNEKAPFAILLNEAPPFEFQTVSILSGQTAVDLGSRYLDLTVTDWSLDHVGSVVEIMGTIENVGVDTAVQTTILASFYDGQGNIIGFVEETLPLELAPAQTSPFTIQTAPPGGTAVNATLFPFAQKPLPTETP